MKHIVNIVFYTVAAALAVCIAAIIIANKRLPGGEVGFDAEALTDSLLMAVNEPAWDALRYVAWTHDGKRDYVWDKWYQLVEIRMKDTRILLNTRAVDGRVWRRGTQLQDAEKRAWLERGWKYWCADSFWFNPVVKLRDPGTKRQKVALKSGESALLVTYLEGGATPGDSYLWQLAEGGLPVKWSMWTRALPVKGLTATWEDWISVDGALVAARREIGPFTIEVTNVRSGDHHSDLGLERDPFTDF